MKDFALFDKRSNKTYWLYKDELLTTILNIAAFSINDVKIAGRIYRWYTSDPTIHDTTTEIAYEQALQIEITEFE